MRYRTEQLTGKPRSNSYFDFAFCAAQRLSCASAIRLRASALSTRFFFLPGPLLVFVLDPGEATAREPASRERTWVSLAISASISARIVSIDIRRGYIIAAMRVRSTYNLHA